MYAVKRSIEVIRSHLQLSASLENVLDNAAKLTLGAAFSLGATLPDGSTIALASGLSDRKQGKSTTPNSSFAFGSATKMVTATAVMRLVEAGTFSLDESIVPLIDPWVRRQKWNGTSLVPFFGETIHNVTVRHL